MIKYWKIIRAKTVADTCYLVFSTGVNHKYRYIGFSYHTLQATSQLPLIT